MVSQKREVQPWVRLSGRDRILGEKMSIKLNAAFREWWHRCLSPQAKAQQQLKAGDVLHQPMFGCICYFTLMHG